MGCYTAPSHSEHDPPDERREPINTDEGDSEDGRLNCQSVSDPPNSSRHHRDSLLASTLLCDHTGHQNGYSLQTHFSSDCFTVLVLLVLKWLNVNSTP